MSLPNQFWRKADSLYEARRQASAREMEHYDREGDQTMRPMIAHWLKSGVIGPSHFQGTNGVCVVLTEPERSPDLYIDYRAIRSNWPSRSEQTITDASGVDLLRYAREFSVDKAHPRFALFRIWSHSHFYPLMLGFENRDLFSSQDEICRYWQWKFVPKDMAGSEYSMQKSIEDRVEPFKMQLGKQVVVKRDILLVMAQDEEELKRLCVAVTFAVQTDPWRLEIDLWKSFVNVNLAFLKALDQAWLE